MTRIPRTVFEYEHEAFRATVRRFLEAEIQPFHDQWEKDGQVERQIWYKAAELGFLCPSVSEEYGGAGTDFRFNAIVNEELARLGLSGPGFTLHSDIVVPYICRYGSDEQKQRYLPRCLSGEIVTAIAMTEPGAGSDLQGIKTTAISDGDEYILNGAKTFISNGQQADLVIVVCKTGNTTDGQRISLLLVETDTPGFQRGRNLEKLGLRAQDTSELFFQEVRVPKKNLLGIEGQGFVYLMQELPQERLSVAISAVASAESILQQTIEYVKEREAFGRKVATFQNTQFNIAQMDAEVSALRVFVDRCLEMHISSMLDTVTASKAKLLAAELLGRVTDECVQLHGGYGYMWEYPVTRAYADARLLRIAGGSSEIMKLIISRSLLES